MSNPKPDLGPDDPLYYAPPRLGERNEQTDAVTGEHGKDENVGLAPRTPDENVAHLRPPIRLQDLRNHKQPDIFAEALARAEQEQFDPDLIEVPSFPRNRQSTGMVGKFAIVATGAAVVALVFVLAFPTSQGPVEDNAASSLPTWESLKSSLFPAEARKPAPMLTVHDNSGYVNEPLELGVSVASPAPGMTVMIKWMPAGARLTAGRRASANEWRVPAQIISDAAIIPPTDFVGELNLAAELRGADGTILVTTFVRLTWTSAQPGSAGASAANAAAAVPPPPAPVAPTPQPQAAASPPPPAAPAVAAPSAPAEPIRELSPNEIAGLVRRAQELLASGDLQGARVLLTRAADAREARAALLLAKTFDPIASRQFSASADPGPDLAQARNWYQKAREWGSPEAQRQLDALASFPRR
jgi:hypothetical protein